ncbi:hypothetical protein CQW23_25595 [Capsicum baccatum]|uniref:Uncharacterized protein n=1 Tax=Capsicum baccatum TaxID=33114 RepID=A0A2G2VLC8_CAPBA|nr:hypothetical protein CQW23_25595 [Capsicum baccatum]
MMIRGRLSTYASEMTPLLWPRQDEMTKCFNLNDTGSPARAVTDLNTQRMAPVDGHADNNVFADSFPPSYCVFKDGVVQLMKPLLEFVLLENWI